MIKLIPHSILIPLIFLVFATFMQACISIPIKKPDQWPYASNAIHFEICANKNLNIYEGLPHAIPVCFYQLQSFDFFKELSLFPEGLNRLLECRSFHPSVVRTYRLTIEPDERKKIVMDREKDVKYVALAASYFIKENKKITRLYEIPVVAERPALIKSTEIVKPGPLKIHIEFGPEQIE
ncbi:type VI secretion protein [Candidatus Magnetomorum sp. HK-1]|nr:type VI secretion protein [Candidatus Magnetomorum sp. HK-1]